MGFLSKKEILAAKNLKTETVEVPELGGQVMIREMTAADRDSWEFEQLKKNGKSYSVNFENLRAKLIVRCVVDSETKLRMFSDSDAELLGNCSAASLDKLYEACQKLNKLSKDDVDDLVKNSVDLQPDNSVSG